MSKKGFARGLIYVCIPAKEVFLFMLKIRLTENIQIAAQ